MSTFLKLKDFVGVTADGNLEPLVEIGAVIPVATMITNPLTKEQEVGEIGQSLLIQPAERLGDLAARIVPGTRMVEIADPRVTGALIATQNWEQADTPTTRAIAAEAQALIDAANEAGTHTDPDESTTEPEA